MENDRIAKKKSRSLSDWLTNCSLNYVSSPSRKLHRHHFSICGEIRFFLQPLLILPCSVVFQRAKRMFSHRRSRKQTWRHLGQEPPHVWQGVPKLIGPGTSERARSHRWTCACKYYRKYSDCRYAKRIVRILPVIIENCLKKWPELQTNCTLSSRPLPLAQSKHIDVPPEMPRGRDP